MPGEPFTCTAPVTVFRLIMCGVGLGVWVTYMLPASEVN